MASVVLGCDYNGANDKKCQNTVARILEKGGHSVEKLAINPNAFAKYSYSSKAKGKIGVFLIASGITAIADLYSGNTHFKYAYFGIRGDLKQPRLSTHSDFEKSPISKDKHGDCTPRICNKLAGKTYPQMNKITKSKCQAVFGTTFEDLGKNILKAIGGANNVQSADSKNVGTIKDAIREVQSGWDGEVECFIRGNTFYVRKIKDPSDSSTLSLIEGKDIFLNSVRVTDYNPSSPNYLTVLWKNNRFIIKDSNLIKRFGRITQEVQAPDTIKTKKEAENFARLEWLKLKRDNGHKLECEVRGHSKWQIAKWVRVYLPSFDIDDFMYISKVSHSDETGDWVNQMVLVDYPPSLGRPEDYEKEEETTDLEEEEADNED